MARNESVHSCFQRIIQIGLLTLKGEQMDKRQFNDKDSNIKDIFTIEEFQNLMKNMFNQQFTFIKEKIVSIAERNRYNFQKYQIRGRRKVC